MTKREADKEFKQNFLEDCRTDLPCIRFRYSMFIDSLHREGIITDRQVNTWTCPIDKIKRK